VWHHRSPSVPLRGAGVRATVFRTEVPGFFALAAGAPILRAARERAVPFRRPLSPCAHRLGERTKKQSPGRVMSSRRRTRQTPGLPCPGVETRDIVPASRVSARKLVPPRAFHGFDVWTRRGTRQVCRIPPPRGAYRPLGRFTPSAPLPREERWKDPVRVGHLLRRSTPCPREALRLSSGTSPGCLELRFYNRRFTSRAPVETSPLETTADRRG
jgi:hypothetical protein